MNILRNIKQIFDYKQMGLLEFMFALFPIVSGYTLGPIPVHLWWLLIMDIIAYNRYGLKIKKIPKKYNYLFWFVTIHNFLWTVVIQQHVSIHINLSIGTFIIMSSFYFICPVIDFEKFKNSLKPLTILSIIGMVYCVFMLTRGVIIGQLPLPPFEQSRNLDITTDIILLRPNSFFPEPQAFCTYMQIPLFLSLLYKKYIVVFVIMISMVLSTSTTGLVVPFLMIGIYFFTQKVSLKWKFFIISIIACSCLLISNTSYFEKTMNKATNTDLSTNERTSVGFMTLPQLNPEELVLGIPYSNLGHMYDDGRISGDYMLLGEGSSHTIFLPTFWSVWFQYGIIGLLLYLMIYIEIYKKSKLLLPFLGTVVVTMFSNPEGVGSTFVYQLCFMYCFIRAQQNNKLTLK